VLVLEDAANPDEIVRHANLQLETHQKIRSASVWPGERLPRTAGTQKIRHAEVQDWVDHGSPAAALPRGGDLTDLVRRYAPDRVITPETTLEDLGLSSLDRVELLMDLEQRFDTSLDESVLTGSRTVADLVEISVPTRTLEFPVWNRSWLARAVRNGALALLWLPLTRMIARAHVSGRQYLIGLHGPVIFAANHQSHLDTPAILAALPARFRYHAAPAMWMEYFDAHFFPERHGRSAWIMQSIAYWLVSLFFNSFPLPQTEAGAGQSLRYLGDLVSEGWSILFFPEGERTETGEIGRFQPGIGLIASRLNVPVVPIRLRGLERVLSRRAHWLRPVRIEIAFGSPLHLRGEDYTALAKQVEAAVRAL
jgi:long-chain acyl-CoA synthetase